MPECPECEALVELDPDDVEEGQLVSCPECGMELEVVNTNPVELDLAEDEDLEEDDEEEEEEEEEEEADESDFGDDNDFEDTDEGEEGEEDSEDNFEE